MQTIGDIPESVRNAFFTLLCAILDGSTTLNDEVMTRRKRQKEQREIFCKLESRVTGYSRFANVNWDDDSFHYAARNKFRLLLDL